MRESVRPPVSLRYHAFRNDVDYESAGVELTNILVATSRSASYGRRSGQIVQLATDVENGKNRCSHTIVKLLFNAQDVGVSFSHLIAWPQALIAMLKARCPHREKYSLKDLQKLETELESKSNPIQWAISTGDNSTQRRHELLALARANKEVWANIEAELEQELYGSVVS